MSQTTCPAFDEPDLCTKLQGLSDAELDALDFGVIAFDAEGRVRRYNQHESTQSSFARTNVLGQHAFVELAPCLNNYLVAGRFAQAEHDQRVLDEVLPYVLTFRMKPTRAKLRLLWQPGAPLSYMAIARANGGTA